MRVKKFLALMMVGAMAGAFVVPTANVKAEGLTQAESPDMVEYGVVTADEIELLKTIFDVDYYIQLNPDLYTLYGTDFDKLFDHFCKMGVFEGRPCNPNFNPAAYSSAYPDLKEAYGLNVVEYYKHYASVGKAENRTLTTLEACANAGISVTTLSKNYATTITPAMYKVAKALGTNDFKTVSTAIEAAANSDTPVKITNNYQSIVISWDDALDKLDNMTKIASIDFTQSISVGYRVSGGLNIYVDANDNYGVYASSGNDTGYRFVDGTDENNLPTSISYYTNSGCGTVYDAADQVIGEDSNGWLIYKTSNAYDPNTAVYVGSVNYRIGEPARPSEVIYGQMAGPGTIDTGAYFHSEDVELDEKEYITGLEYMGQYNDGMGLNMNDPNGSIDTQYDLAIGFEETDDGKTKASFAIYSDESEYADISEAIIDHPINTDDTNQD